MFVPIEPKMLFISAWQTIGYFIEGLTGFGGTVFSSAINAEVLGAGISVPFQTCITLPVLYWSFITCYKQASMKDLGKILLAVLPGLLLGNYIGMIINVNYAKLAIGAVVVFIALMNIWNHIVKPLVLKIPTVEKEDGPAMKVVRIIFLVAGGMVHGAFNIGGPLITVYTLHAVKDKVKFRNTMLCLWATVNTLNVARQILSGNVTPYVFTCVCLAIPFTFLGYILGKKMMNKVDRAVFLRIVYVVLLIVAGNMLLTTIPKVFG